MYMNLWSEITNLQQFLSPHYAILWVLEKDLKWNISSNVCLLCVCFGFMFVILCKPYFKIFSLTWFDLLNGWSHLSLQGVGLTPVIQTVGLMTHYGYVVLSLWESALIWAVSVQQKKPVRRRYESYGMYSDDDANSDASSACSERSYSSRNGSIPTYMRQTEDVAEVLNRCASTNWSERKEGLLGLQNLLKNQRTLR